MLSTGRLLAVCQVRALAKEQHSGSHYFKQSTLRLCVDTRRHWEARRTGPRQEWLFYQSEVLPSQYALIVKGNLILCINTCLHFVLLYIQLLTRY